ncbi:MAG: carbohydrate ABC transporter permease [Caldilineaceae bacterium]|jgi:multiple sugar transport system permease protein
MTDSTDISQPIVADAPAEPSGAVIPARGSRGWRSGQARFFAYMLAPSVILLTLITILPVIFLIATSFTSWDLSRPGSLKFVQLQNYVRVFTKDDRFWNSVMVQLKLSLLTVPAQVALGLALAVFLKERIKSKWIVELSRSTLLMPMVIPPIVAALIWKIIFTPPVSIFSYVSVKLGLGPLNWLGHPQLALLAIAIASVWEFFPFSFLLLYAGLLSLPEEPYEAALVDGATRWQTFVHVTLPMLMPTINIVLLFRIIDSIRAFPLIYVMTQGGPGFATEPTNFYAYTQAFTFTYVGYSSAMIVVVLAFTMVLTGIVLNRIKWNRGAVT